MEQIQLECNVCIRRSNLITKHKRSLSKLLGCLFFSPLNVLIVYNDSCIFAGIASATLLNGSRLKNALMADDRVVM